jgi:cytochrome P450
MHDPDYNEIIPPHVPSSLVRDHNIFDYSTQDPFLTINELFEAGVPEIFWTRHNGGHWIVMGAEATTQLGADAALFSSTRPMVPDHANADTASFIPLTSDPPIHKQYRGVIAPLFTPQRIGLVEESIRTVTESRIDEILHRGECEFMEDFAAQMPVVVFLRLLDLPLLDRGKLLDLTHRVLYPVEDGHYAKPLQALTEYLQPLVAERMASPGSDIISHIVSQKFEVAGRPLLLPEMLQLCTSVLLAGLDTVVSMLGFFAHYLAENPGERCRLRGSPELQRKAVEEVLRRYPVSNIGRIVMWDTVFRGVTMKKGDHVMWPVGTYNFDKRRFPDPMKVDLDRKRPPHATFGTGEHFCVGSVLARTELRIFAERWLERIPEFHVKPGAKIEYRGGFNINYKALPLVVGAATG